MPAARTSTQLTGAAGEYYVATELSRRGWAASITPRGVQRSDVLAQHMETAEVVAIQVKTSSGGVFRMGPNMELVSPEQNEWVVRVRLAEAPVAADYYVVPRNVAASFIYVDHRRWLHERSRRGQPHHDNPVRALPAAAVDSYRDGWDRLALSTRDVPYTLPEWFFEYATGAIGLPEGHPGPAQRNDGLWYEPSAKRSGSRRCRTR